MMYQDNFFSSIYKLLATKTDGRRSTYLQFEEDRRGLDPFFVEESGGRTVDVQGSCRLEESGSRGECRSGGATSAQEGEERWRREEWRRKVVQGVQIRREATSRRRGKKPQGTCRRSRKLPGDAVAVAATAVQTNLAPPFPLPPPSCARSAVGRKA